MPCNDSSDQPTYHWLPALLKAHALVDKAVKSSLENEAASTRRRPACKKGCDDCCSHVIPVSAPEIAGALWQLTRRTSAGLRARVQRNLHAARGRACPFLVDATCSIYPLRFMACRQFIIFGAPCPGGEDVSLTRGGDLLTPDRNLKLKAFEQLATLYGLRPQLSADEKFLRRFIMDVSPPMQDWDFARSETILLQLEKKMLCYRGRDFFAPGLAAPRAAS
ncbi:MAG: YkgJ family cysteine cluster protein [Desulfovibrionaceae bacterium]|nr:YkgJ family cysteine cluster protein [Desulfovibrionaceae bacterium]MBF0512900.1 YkgJ family cysteine cluster protein [Desulfovibrionaceae bacterium]